MQESAAPGKKDGSAAPRVVVVGAGFGGLAVVRAFQGQGMRLTLVDRTNHHLFQPLLYQVATAGLNPAEIAAPVRHIFSRREDVTCLLGTVTGVDFERRNVEVDGGARAVPYDYLVLAVGGRTSYFGHDEWERIAPGLKTLQDARIIRERVLRSLEQAEHATDEAERGRLMTIVVVGGGPTGVELAGAFAELTRFTLAREFRNIRPEQSRIMLVEAGPRLLAAFPERLGAYARRRLEQMGVRVLTDTRVTGLAPDHLEIGDQKVPTRNVVWAAGVQAEPLGKALGLPVDRAMRIAVEPDLRAPGQERVYAIGDAATFLHDPSQPGTPLPGLSPVAIQMGQHVARNLLAQLRGRPTQPFRYHDPGTMATIGRSAAIAVVGKLRLSGFVAWLAWLFVHLMKMVDFQNKVMVLSRWAWAYLTWRRGARLIVDYDDELAGAAAPASEAEVRS